MVYTVSCDEKPGIQVIVTTGNVLHPAQENGCVMRDAEYNRLGTLSLLARIVLLTKVAIPHVSETHKNSDFIELLKTLDEHYPKGNVIRIVCDNHLAHKPKETAITSPQDGGSFYIRFYSKAWILVKYD